MKKIKITVIRKACYKDLTEQYENPIEHACDMREGQVFIADGWQKPEGLCDSAWQTLSPFVMTLAHGGTNIYDGWMKNPESIHTEQPRYEYHPPGILSLRFLPRR